MKKIALAIKRIYVSFGLIFAGLFICFLTACENDLERVKELNPEAFVNKEVTKDVELTYSDSAIIRTVIRAPEMIQHVDAKSPRQEFTKGIIVEFYNENNRVNSTLTADYAIRYDKLKRIIVQQNVVWKSGKPEVLETEELIWNEQDAKVSSQRYVKITTPEDEFYGYGLEADEDFSWWKINVPEGEMNGDGF